MRGGPFRPSERRTRVDRPTVLPEMLVAHSPRRDDLLRLRRRLCQAERRRSRAEASAATETAARRRRSGRGGELARPPPAKPAPAQSSTEGLWLSRPPPRPFPPVAPAFPARCGQPSRPLRQPSARRRRPRTFAWPPAFARPLPDEPRVRNPIAPPRPHARQLASRPAVDERAARRPPSRLNRSPSTMPRATSRAATSHRRQPIVARDGHRWDGTEERSDGRPMGSSMGASIGAVPISPANTGSPLPTTPQEPGPLPPTGAIRPGDVCAHPPRRSRRLRSHNPGVAPLLQRPRRFRERHNPLARSPPPELVAFGIRGRRRSLSASSVSLLALGRLIGSRYRDGRQRGPRCHNPISWAWGMPAAIPLVLLTGLTLGAAVGSDRAPSSDFRAWPSWWAASPT